MSPKNPYSTPHAAKRAVLEHQTFNVLSRLKTALLGLTESIPGLTDRPADLARTLDLHAKLAWQVHRLAHGPDPLATVGQVPGPEAMRRFLEAATRRGAVDARITEARAAHSAYEALITTHASSRAEFDSIVSGLARNGSEQVDLRHRRAAFKAQSHLLGLQAETQFMSFILGPDTVADGESSFINVMLQGFLGLRRLRHDASLIAATLKLANDDGSPREIADPEPLAPPNHAAGVGLMPEFCSRPLSTMKQVRVGKAQINVEMEPPGLGRTSAVTCILGHIIRNKGFSRFRSEESQHHTFRTMVRAPCAVLVNDVLVRQGLFGGNQPAMMLYTEHRGVDPDSPGRERDRIVTHDPIIYFGSGLDALATDDVPQCKEMYRFAFNRIGWNVEEFDVYRCRIAFPVMPSSVVVQFNLPEKP